MSKEFNDFEIVDGAPATSILANAMQSTPPMDVKFKLSEERLEEIKNARQEREKEAEREEKFQEQFNGKDIPKKGFPFIEDEEIVGDLSALGATPKPQYFVNEVDLEKSCLVASGVKIEQKFSENRINYNLAKFELCFFSQFNIKLITIFDQNQPNQNFNFQISLVGCPSVERFNQFFELLTAATKKITNNEKDNGQIIISKFNADEARYAINIEAKNLENKIAKPDGALSLKYIEVKQQAKEQLKQQCQSRL